MPPEKPKMNERLTASHPPRQSGRNPMALSPGTRFGHYEILSALGAGGMGEVYRARDTRLGREVALKVLPAELCEDKERLRRFEQEARSAAALNHPNIVTIHELGQLDSTRYIAMELVEGKPLRALLVAGSVPMRKLIELAAQAADGLAKAHEAGIVHRDLKPENLMVSAEGVVKILDFGLAKLVVPTSEASSTTTTVAGGATHPGTLLGTIAYMSPEQASGEAVGFQSDHFSLGSVLYEMATGKRPFQKGTQAGTLASILRDEPEPIGSVNPEAPAPLCWVIERCLAKEPEKRYDSTRDLARELAAIRDHLLELPGKSLEARPSNLPVPRTALVGREKEVAALRDLLLRREARLVTVTGPGGIGKTRLGLEVAKEMADHFPAGVYFVSLAAVSEPGLISSVVAQTIGVREAGGQSPAEALQEYARSSLRQPMLLFLDNFEHLVEAAPMVAELLASGSNLKVLVASRSPLRVYGECEFPVPLLALPSTQRLPPLEELSRYSAIALFTQRAAALQSDFKLTEENAPAVAEICARLDGLPLAIELAAARIKLLSPSAIRAHLESRLQLLKGGARDLPARQQTLRGAIDWSHDLLTEPERKLFRRLSVFTGGCTLEAVEAVCNTQSDLGADVLDGMTTMVDESLVQRMEPTGGEPRFALLETIREYGLEKLGASGEEALTRRAHAAYCLVLAEEGASEAAEAERAAWLERFEIEHDNFRAALEWLTETSEVEWGLRLGAALFHFWEMREYLAEGRERLGKLLSLEGTGQQTQTRVRALFAAGVLAGEQGDYASADKLHEESLGTARELKDKRSIAVSLNALAVNARDRGDLSASRSWFEENLGLWKELGDRQAVARSLSNLANVVKMQGDFPRARALYEESLAIFQELGDRTGVAWSLNYKGDIAREQSDLAGARSLYEASLAAFQELGDRWGMAASLGDLGNLARDQKDYTMAHSFYCKSMRMFQELQHKRGMARLLECLACLAAAQSEPERCLRLAGAAAALRQTLGAPLTPREQAKLEKGLAPAQQALPHAARAAAWLEGWRTPVEKSLEEALTPL